MRREERLRCLSVEEKERLLAFVALLVEIDRRVKVVKGGGRRRGPRRQSRGGGKDMSQPFYWLMSFYFFGSLEFCSTLFNYKIWLKRDMFWVHCINWE